MPFFLHFSSPPKVFSSQRKCSIKVERAATTLQMLSSWLWQGQDLWGSVNLTCILKGNNRGINSKLTLSGPSNSLGVTDVHDQVKLGKTSKGGQKRGSRRTTTCFHIPPVPALLFIELSWRLFAGTAEQYV